MAPLKVFEVAAATVSLFEDHMESRYSDGAASLLFFPPWADVAAEQQHTAATQFAGYGSDRVRMAREHELMHHIIAETIGYHHSFTVWVDAHGMWGSLSPEARQQNSDEEHLVVSMQRYIMTGLLDDYNVLEYTFGKWSLSHIRPAITCKLKGLLALP